MTYRRTVGQPWFEPLISFIAMTKAVFVSEMEYCFLAYKREIRLIEW